ncbi:CLIP-associating protein 1-like isoform X2 [Actinia tenebrosa]|uniref:CLIP-associating protein 1-like isoform X2 n=1 Tax=Actinia tenebrosa TaxID=6105 RepID=A0A6P8IJ29_ACTTE|nr:CLIP-associating protein 1-like isoform X2 [Actinia tenebrosa]
MKDIPFLEDILASVWSQDTQKRLKAAEELSNYLSEPSNDIEFGGYDKLIDGLIAWVNSSNFRVSLSGLDILHQIVDKIGPGFKNSLLPVVPAITERLGDSKQQVRDHAQDLIQKFMYPVSTPQHVLEHLVPAFSHKAWRVREEVLHCLVRTLTSFGASHITVSKFVPYICKLLGDPNSQVRERAIETLVEIYRHVGEKVRIDLSKKGIPSSRLSLIYAKFDEVAKSGTMQLSEPDGPLRVNGDVNSEEGKTSPTHSRGGSAKKLSSGRKTNSNKNSNSGTAAGAIDETDFVNSYDDCPNVRIYSSKDLSDEMTKIQNVLSDDKNDWEQRIAAMKKIRSTIHAGALEHNDFLGMIKNLEGAFKLNAKDLRSSVIRETCITLSYLSTQLGSQFDHTAEAVFPCLMSLIPNSAKIMATSGDACINIILKNTHAHRLISILVSNMASKSSVLRRNCASKLHLVLDIWETQTIRNHVVELEDFIRKGISDADSECRATARRAFWAYHKHFPEKAESILKTLDPSKQKQLENDRNGTGLIKASTGRAAPVRLPKPSSAPRSRGSSTSSTHSEDGATRSSAPTRNAPHSSLTRSNYSQASRSSASRAVPSSGYLSPMSNMGRSRSHIDSRAAERASRRAQTRATATRPPSPPSSRQGRFPTRGYVSQPSSRSQSPDRLGFAAKERSEAFVHGTSPIKSRIPTPNRPRTSSRSSSRASSRSSSRGTSRDPSPDTIMRRERRISEGKGFSPTQLPVMKRSNVQNPVVQRVKQQQPTDDDEAGLTEAAVWDSWTKSPARRKFSFGSTNSHGSDEDADSDAGSSERSMGTRGNRTLSRAEPGNEIAEIVRLCTSNNSWSDRRDGVSALLVFLKSSRVMSDLELSKVKDCLTRLFFDPHNKVYSSFLDALAEFIVVHKVDIQDWLFVLLSRLLTKLGTEMLNSLQSKVVGVLDVVRDSFPYDLQFSILTRFITDQTQTPNLKVKIAVLQYLQGLISLMDSSDFTNSGETRLAVSRIISWTTEPKSAEVRKESAAVIVALFELNTPEFSMMLSVLPKSFQDGATKLLHSHLKSSSQGNEPISSSRGVASTRGYATSYDETDINTTSPDRPKLRLGYRSMSSSSLKGLSKDDDQSGRDSPGASTSSEGSIPHPEHRGRTASPKLTMSPKTQQKFGFPSKSPKTNSGEGDAIGDSIDNRQSSPFKLRKQSKQEAHEDTPSVSSGYNSDDVNSAHGDGAVGGHGSPRTNKKTSGHEYDPKQYQDTQNDFHPMPELNGFSTGRKKKTSETLDELDRSLEGIETTESSFEKADASALDQEDSLDDLLGPLHDPSSDKVEDKRGALVDILRMVREDSSSLWNSFPKVFSALAKAVDDVQPSIRTLTLRVLKDMVRAQPFAFHQVSGTTISKILQAHKDPQKEVVRQAEEAAGTVAKSLLPKDCIRVLGPIIRDSDFPVSLAAIKMLTKVVEGVDSETVEDNLNEVIPGLVKCYDHIESSVRKASVFCLVALHSIVGEEVLLPHLAELSGTKMKLLNLYIKRSQASAGGVRP